MRISDSADPVGWAKRARGTRLRLADLVLERSRAQTGWCDALFPRWTARSHASYSCIDSRRSVTRPPDGLDDLMRGRVMIERFVNGFHLRAVHRHVPCDERSQSMPAIRGRTRSMLPVWIQYPSDHCVIFLVERVRAHLQDLGHAGRSWPELSKLGIVERAVTHTLWGQAPARSFRLVGVAAVQVLVVLCLAPPRAWSAADRRGPSCGFYSHRLRERGNRDHRLGVPAADEVQPHLNDGGRRHALLAMELLPRRKVHRQPQQGRHPRPLPVLA